MYEGRTLNDKNERLPCYPKRAKCYMKPYFPGVPRHWERLEHWDSLSSRSLHASRLFPLNHLLSSYALFVIARLLRGQKEKERGRKVTDDKNSAESTKKKGYFHLEIYAAILQRPSGLCLGWFHVFLLFKASLKAELTQINFISPSRHTEAERLFSKGRRALSLPSVCL